MEEHDQQFEPQSTAPEQDTPAQGDASPGGDQEAPTVQAFNQEVRDGIEDAYDRYIAAERGEPMQESQPPAPAQPQQDTPQQDQGFSTAQPTDDGQPKLKYRSHEEAERGAEEAARKMHEATQRASQLERDNESLRSAALKILANVQAQASQPTPPQRPAPAPQFNPNQPIPGLDYERIEEETGFSQPQVNFLLTAMSGLRENVIKETNDTVVTREQINKRETAREQFNREAEQYFQTKHAPFVPIRETVMRMTHQLWEDKPFIDQVMRTPGKKPVEKFGMILDEAVERVKRDRLPGLLSALGVQSQAQGGVTREPLQSGNPPVMPRSAGAPVVRAAPVDRGETFDEYIASRRKAQDRMMSGFRGRQ